MCSIGESAGPFGCVAVDDYPGTELPGIRTACGPARGARGGEAQPPAAAAAGKPELCAAYALAQLQDGVLTVSVTDDGVGGARSNYDGTGLVSITDRITALKGHVQIISPPGQGTRVTMKIPCV